MHEFHGAFLEHHDRTIRRRTHHSIYQFFHYAFRVGLHERHLHENLDVLRLTLDELRGLLSVDRKTAFESQTPEKLDENRSKNKIIF